MNTLEQLTTLLKDGGVEAMLAISLVANYFLFRKLYREMDKRVELARETGTLVNTLLTVTARLSDMADWFHSMRNRWGNSSPKE